MNIIGIVFLAIFLALMTGIGVWGMKKTKTLGDFFLGGRTMGPWVSAAAYGTTYFSAAIFIGFAGAQGWQFGLNSLWIALGNGLLGAGLAWIILARRTRRMTQNLDSMTMPQFLQERYEAKHLKPIAATIVFFFLLPYSAGVFKGLNYLFQKGFGIPGHVAILIMIAFTAVYMILGGYFAIAFTDFIQAIIMFAGALALVLVITGPEGGVFGILEKIKESYAANVPLAARPTALTIISLVFMTSFGTWGLPQMTQKFYAIKNEKVILRAAIVTTVFALTIGFTAYYTGASVHVFFSKFAEIKEIFNVPAGGRVDYDLIIPTLLTIPGMMPNALVALILLLVLSASMSTLASLVLVSSSAIAIDLYPLRVDDRTGKDRSVAMMRFLSAVFIMLSLLISYLSSEYKISIIVNLMSLSWGVVSGAFAAPYILGLYSKRITKAGAYAGLFTGVTIMITLFFVLGQKNSPLAASIAIIVPFIVVTVVSLFTAPPKKEILDRAFAGI